MAKGRWYRTGPVRPLLASAGLLFVILGVAVATSARVDNFILAAIALLKGQPPDPHWQAVVRLSGLELLLEGVVLLVLAWVVVPRWAEVLSYARKKRVLLLAGSLMLLILWLPIIHESRSAIIAGERHWWLGDDQMIAMRYARNLANGMGLVWNAGERVEGYTNLLWTVYMALVHLFPIPAAKTSLVILITNMVLAVATVPMIIRLVDMLEGSPLVTIAALASYVLSKDTMYYATYGFETALLTLLVTAATYRVIQESKWSQPRFTTYLLIGTLSIVRADGIVASALLYGISLILNEKSKQVLVYSAISLLLPVGYEVFRVCYYGEILPNTAYLKTMNWGGKYASGMRYVGRFALRHIVPLLLAILGSVLSRERSRRMLLGLLAVYGAYVVYVGGDVHPGFRFLVPVLPLLMVLSFLGIQELGRIGVRQFSRLALGATCILTVPLIIPGYAATLFPYPPDRDNVVIGVLVRENTPATVRVADNWAGSVFYFSERYGVDLLGINDYHIARLPTVSDGAQPGHNKFDFDYSLGVLRPDLVIGNFRLPVDEIEMRQAAMGDWAFTGRLYFHPLFHEHCLPNPIVTQTLRTIFVCDWSDQVISSDAWGKLETEG